MNYDISQRKNFEDRKTAPPGGQYYPHLVVPKRKIFQETQFIGNILYYHGFKVFCENVKFP